MNDVTDKQLVTIIETTQEYLIKGGNYKSSFNGQSISMQFYDYKTNRLFSQTPNSDTLFWFDALELFKQLNLHPNFQKTLQLFKMISR